jgi:predicted Zn-dependent protease
MIQNIIWKKVSGKVASAKTANRREKAMSVSKRVGILIIILFFIMSSCAVNPVTEKREIMLFSDQDEIAMGKQGNEAVLVQFGTYDDQSLQRYIDHVGQQIAQVCHRKDLPHHYTVVDSAVLNAFALPGGYVYITRGLLAHLNNEAQLASILGHETGHIAARHGVKKYQKAIGAQLILVGVAVATESQGLALGTNLLLNAILQGYSRKDERQADELGALYMYRASYNPLEMPKFFSILERMEERSPNAIAQLFASHPPTPDRVETTTLHAQELTGGKTAGLTIAQNQYISHLDGLVFGPGERDGVIEGNHYKNRYFRYGIQMPQGWKIQRGETAGSLLAQDPSQRYLSQVIPLELKETMTPDQLAATVERNSGLQPAGAAWITVDGTQVYRADYRARSQDGVLLGLRIAYVTRGKTGFIIANIARLQEFSRGRETFNTVIFSFRSLSSKEVAKVPLNRLQVYKVKIGDTFPAISRRFYGTTKHADDIKQFNGMDELSSPPVGDLIKIKPLLPETSQENGK